MGRALKSGYLYRFCRISALIIPRFKKFKIVDQMIRPISTYKKYLIALFYLQNTIGNHYIIMAK